MIIRFETTVPDDPKLALARAQVLLNGFGFQPTADGYRRGTIFGSGGGLHPRQVNAEITLRLQGSEVVADLKTDRRRGPSSALERHVWQGEMDDLRAALEGVPNAGVDRAREDRAAGTLAGLSLLTVLILLFLSLTLAWEYVLVLAPAALAVPVLMYALVPFRMPHYPSRDVPSDLSNYPR